MATKAKTALKGGEKAAKQACPECGEEIKVVKFAGYGRKGLFWVCEKKDCGYTQRTH